MKETIYILSSYDKMAHQSSMRTVGVTSDENILYSMISTKIHLGDMSYKGLEGLEAVVLFQQDLGRRDADLDKLGNGVVSEYANIEMNNLLTYVLPKTEIVPNLSLQPDIKAKLDSLDLEHRSLMYSLVDIHTDCGCERMVISGICDCDRLKSSNRFQEMMGCTAEAEINAVVYSLIVGTGKAEHPTEDELIILAEHGNDINALYEITVFQNDFISFIYKKDK